MKKIVKKNYKTMILGIIVGILISSIGVYALSSLSSSDVSYDNSSSEIEADTMQGAIDELYDKVKKNQVPDVTKLPNLVSALKYHETKDDDYCITGDEDTCKVSDCYKNKDQDSCEPGTIINYKVNDSKIVRFHVVHDDGETMTLQSQKNTVYSTQWYMSSDNTHGPIVALDTLENATNDWTNVNTLDYTISDSNSELGYSGCAEYNYCMMEKYSLDKESVQARMLTVQESEDVGCANYYSTCPIWMYNYLDNSTSYGGTNNDPSAYRYWLMSAFSSNSASAWAVSYYGQINYDDSTYSHGIRAVVVISK